MNDNKKHEALLTIDLIRYRFRVSMQTLRNLGNPSYIQFLVNPEEGFIAILGTNKPMSGGSANKVELRHRKKSYTTEFYSSALIDSLLDTFGILDIRNNYQLKGDIDSINRIAYFSMDTLTRIERRRNDES